MSDVTHIEGAGVERSMVELGPLLERLLAGEFICAVSDEGAFRRLQDEATRERIDAYLRPLNRRLAATDEGSVYFLAWRRLDDAAREQLSRQLGDTVASLMPLLEWLQLVQEALGRDGLAAPGDVLKPADFSRAARITRACASVWSGWPPTPSSAPRATSSTPSSSRSSSASRSTVTCNSPTPIASTSWLPARSIT